jgi:hypothetical protein
LQESVDTLINCVVENVGFSEGKPVAAITIYKCLLHWRIFETDRTNVFDRLIQIFGSAMQVVPSLNSSFAHFLISLGDHVLLSHYSYLPKISCISQKQDNNADLAYWLSNSSSLLIILQKSLKPPGSSVTTPMKRPQTQTSFLGRMVCLRSIRHCMIYFYSSADLVPREPLLAKIPCCNVSKIITKIMYVVHIELSIAATIQFEIHARCQETK